LNGIPPRLLANSRRCSFRTSLAFESGSAAGLSRSGAGMSAEPVAGACVAGTFPITPFVSFLCAENHVSPRLVTTKNGSEDGGRTAQEICRTGRTKRTTGRAATDAAPMSAPLPCCSNTRTDYGQRRQYVNNQYQCLHV
jgi:hypothetical protein